MEKGYKLEKVTPSGALEKELIVPYEFGEGVNQWPSGNKFEGNHEESKDLDHFIGSQIQLRADFGYGSTKKNGTGVIVQATAASKIEKKNMLPNIYVVITAARNFTNFCAVDESDLHPRSVDFSYHSDTIEINNIPLFKWCFYKNIFSQLTKNYYDDLALGFFFDPSTNNNDEKKMKHIELCDVSIAKDGDKILVAGYPSGCNRNGFFRIGNINKKHLLENEAIITYSPDVGTTLAEVGSPVYLERTNDENGIKSYSLIGIHVGYDSVLNENIAIGFTLSTINWIDEMVRQLNTKIMHETTIVEPTVGDHLSQIGKSLSYRCAFIKI